MRISDWSSDVCSSDLLADPAVRLLTSTVTEKGYCLAPDGTLDLSHPDIVHDLADRAAPVSIVGWIVAGLAARRAAGTAPFAVLCCDHMNGNGAKLGRSEEHTSELQSLKRSSSA